MAEEIAMTSRNKRQKASDVFREGNFLLASRVSFSEGFPSIRELRVEVAESGQGVRTSYGPALLTEKTCGEYFDCSNTLCVNGGFSIGSILRDMVKAGETERQVTRFCQGYEGSPKGRRNYGPCDDSFDVTVKILYHGESA
jgi:hypothetical protein